MTDPVLDALKQVFRLGQFRPGQEAIVRAAVDGRDLLAILPTGGGKSLCFQLPAMVRKGTMIVISPLIALMQDQIRHLAKLKIPAACLNSAMSSDEIAQVTQQLHAGALKLLYIAPERAMSPAFLNGTLKTLQASGGVSGIAVDEAHCVSAWGHDFRPDYRNLTGLRDACPGVPLFAFTATATERVRTDIVSELKLRDPLVHVGSFNRTNLHYGVREKNPSVIGDISKLIRNRGSTIVYCQARKRTEEVAEQLNLLKIRALPYHAGMSTARRSENQERFITNDVQVIVATVAFGMGVNKPDVRWVIHHDLPQSMEAYYQEAGRAGRDGLPASCVLFFAHKDVETARWLIGRKTDPTTGAALVDEQKIALSQLDHMVKYASEPVCRRRSQLAYFAERYISCGKCDACEGKAFRIDPTSRRLGHGLNHVPRLSLRFR